MQWKSFLVDGIVNTTDKDYVMQYSVGSGEETMLDNRLRTILDCLSENEFVSMDTICKRTQRSEKTIRKQLTELGGILGKNGAEIVRKYGKGYQIVVQDRKSVV